jgi:integrase
VRYIKPYGMHRTCGPLLAAFDVHPRVAMRILRHSKIAITMEIYTDASDDIAREALRKLGEQLDGQSLLHEDQKGRFQDRNRPLTWWS